MCRRLVDEHQGPVREHRPDQCQPGPLARGQPSAVLADRGVEPAGEAGDHVGEADPAQCGPQLGVVGVRAGHGEVVPDRARLQPGTLGEPGDPGAPVGQRLRPEPDRSRLHGPVPDGKLTGERGQERRLAAARGSDHRHQGPRRQVHDPGKVQGGRRPAGVGDPEVPDRHTGPRTGGGTAVRGVRSDLREQLLGRREGGGALGSGVELRAHPPQRPVGLGGEQQHHQRRTQVQRATRQPEPDDDRDQGDGQGGDQLEHRGGREREPQRRQGRAAVLVGDPADGRRLRPRPSVYDERREALHDVDEVPGQGAERRPLPVRPVTGGHPDQDGEHRHQRQGDGDDPGSQQVLGGDRDQGQRREDDGEQQGRKISREVGVDRGDAPGDQQRQLPGPLPGGPGGRQLEHGVHQPAAQPSAHGGRGAGRAEVRDQPGQGPQHDRGRGQPGRHGQPVDLAVHHHHDQVRDREDLGDQQAGADDARGHHPGQGRRGRPQMLHQPRVGRPHRVGLGVSTRAVTVGGGGPPGMWCVEIRLRNTQ